MLAACPVLKACTLPRIGARMEKTAITKTVSTFGKTLTRLAGDGACIDGCNYQSNLLLGYAVVTLPEISFKSAWSDWSVRFGKIGMLFLHTILDLGAVETTNVTYYEASMLVRVPPGDNGRRLSRDRALFITVCLLWAYRFFRNNILLPCKGP